MNDTEQGFRDGLAGLVRRPFRPPVLVRLAVIGALVLVLLYPVSRIRALVSERHDRAREASLEVSSIWGGRQEIGGPVLVVPWRARTTDDKGVTRETERRALFLPDSLKVTGNVVPERRHRGLFETVVYRAQLRVEASFGRPDPGSLGIPAEDVAWEKAVVSVGVPDLRGVRGDARLERDGTAVPFVAGSAAPLLWTSGLTAPVPLAASKPDGAVHRVSFDLGIQGSERLHFLPFGRETVVELSSAWPSPSFGGAFLPEERTVDAKGFRARWRVSSLGRGYPQQWRDPDVSGDGSSVRLDSGSRAPSVDASSFGVGLVLPADAYLKTERSLKYAILFVVLTFATFFLFEVLAPVDLHPVQYLLVGAAMCLFYLLLLSISEQAPFGAAYAAASAATVALVSGYSAAILRGRLRALVLGGLLGVLYGYLWVLLRAEDLALLLGSVGLFAILATLMFLTRRIDWGSGAVEGPVAP